MAYMCDFGHEHSRDSCRELEGAFMEASPVYIEEVGENAVETTILEVKGGD